MNHKNYYAETKKLSEKEQVHLSHTFLQRISALLTWFFTVLTEICSLTAISSYFIPSLLASKNTSLHFFW